MIINWKEFGLVAVPNQNQNIATKTLVGSVESGNLGVYKSGKNQGDSYLRLKVLFHCFEIQKTRSITMIMNQKTYKNQKILNFLIELLNKNELVGTNLKVTGWYKETINNVKNKATGELMFNNNLGPLVLTTRFLTPSFFNSIVILGKSNWNERDQKLGKLVKDKFGFLTHEGMIDPNPPQKKQWNQNQNRNWNQNWNQKQGQPQGQHLYRQNQGGYQQKPQGGAQWPTPQPQWPQPNTNGQPQQQNTNITTPKKTYLEKKTYE